MRRFRLLKVGIFSTALQCLTSPVFSEQGSISQSLLDAENIAQNERGTVIYGLENCVLSRSSITFEYCDIIRQGPGDRVSQTKIHLDEVSEIEVVEHRERQQVRFRLDVPTPGFAWSWTDRIANGKDGAFERYSARRQELFDSTELKSTQIFSRCDSDEPNVQKQRDFTLIFENRPDSLGDLVEVARQCRAEKTFIYSDSE